MKQPTIITKGKVMDYMDDILAALQRQDVVTWITKNGATAVVVEANNSQGRNDVMIPNGAGHDNIAHKTIFEGINTLKIGQVFL